MARYRGAVGWVSVPRRGFIILLLEPGANSPLRLKEFDKGFSPPEGIHHSSTWKYARDQIPTPDLRIEFQSPGGDSSFFYPLSCGVSCKEVEDDPHRFSPPEGIHHSSTNALRSAGYNKNEFWAYGFSPPEGIHHSSTDPELLAAGIEWAFQSPGGDSSFFYEARKMGILPR